MKMVFLLFFTMWILSFAGCSCAWEEALDAQVDAARDIQIQAIQDVLKIKSYNHGSAVTPSEGVKTALDYVLALAEEMGFKVVKHPDCRYGYAEYGDASLKEMVMVLGHLDTVPEGTLTDWTEAGPFEGKIVDGKIIGRGATDDKGPIVSSLYSLKAIKESGVKLGRRIRIFFGTSEDGAGGDGLSWSCVSAYADLCEKGEEEWPTLGFSPDTDNFAVTYIEKASITTKGKLPQTDAKKVKLLALKGGTATNAVADSCSATLEALDSNINLEDAVKKAFADQTWASEVTVTGSGKAVSFEVKGVAAHSGQAWRGKSANLRALYILSKLASGEQWEEYASKLVALVGLDTAEGEDLGIKQGGTEFDDIVTSTMGLLALNENNEITFNINTRYPDSGADLLVPSVKHHTGLEIKEKIIKAFQDKGFEVGDEKEVTVSGGAKPYTIPWGSEIVVKLRRTYEKAASVDKKPVIIYGGTYASAWRNRPVDADKTPFGYRMAPWGLEAGGNGHSANEFISVNDMIAGTKIIARALADLALATIP